PNRQSPCRLNHTPGRGRARSPKGRRSPPPRGSAPTPEARSDETPLHGGLLGIGAALAIRRVWRRFGTQQLPAQDADPPPTVPGEPPPTGRGEDSPETKGEDLASLTSAELYRRAQAAAI